MWRVQPLHRDIDPRKDERFSAAANKALSAMPLDIRDLIVELLSIAEEDLVKVMESWSRSTRGRHGAGAAGQTGACPVIRRFPITP